MCRVCGGTVHQFFDFGRQPLSDMFLGPGDLEHEFFFRLAVGICESCTMTQLMDEVARDRMFHDAYPYHSSGSVHMRRHFEQTANRFLDTHLSGRGPDPFIVEIGCNDGVMLRTLGKAGVRHLGVEPSGGVADLARANGVRVRTDFFEEPTAADIVAEEGTADLIYAANTICHIPYIGSIFRGVDALLAPDGAFVFEDPYLGDILDRTTFDQIYDEHFFFFTVRSVQAVAARHGFEVVDVERLPVHGGEVRYTITRRGTRTPTAAVAELADLERARGLGTREAFDPFAADIERIRHELVTLLRGLAAEGKRVVGYGATAKSATVTNYCGIGPELISFVCDATPAKHGKLMPGSHIPVRPGEALADPYPDYAVLFAWNHAEEIMAKERAFHEAGGRWILYVPEVHIV
ncbi:class I SAM-dependent methyltransferase [Actinomadura sp. KC345]|uniref:class I SAM-dependent methyltransferase n=1 Tax=Actinomadura sp. KC345 TaxID=2530371 RepID=UPI0010537DE5|nr:class I SAM-dependent methyltransferase [Actinomadura sp. KC345]TDC44518.1 class I SAM-dependent methyltransferase [Actinomadura sp. KC345]